MIFEPLIIALDAATVAPSPPLSKSGELMAMSRVSVILYDRPEEFYRKPSEDKSFNGAAQNEN